VIKRRSKKISLLLVLMMIATLIIGVGTAAASSTGAINPLKAPTLTDDPDKSQAAGAIKVTVDAGSISADDSVIMKLPSGFDFFTAFSETVVATHTSGKNEVVVPLTVNAAGDSNAFNASDITIDTLDVNDEIQITANSAQDASMDFIFYVYLDAIEVDSGTNDDLAVVFDANENSGFPQGTVIAGKSSSSGAVTLSVTGTDTEDADGTFDFELRIKEDTAGSLSDDDESLKLKLPSGFEWKGASTQTVTLDALWGEDITVTINRDEEELTIDFAGETTEASAWDIPATALEFGVEDEDSADEGDVTMNISGDTDANIPSVVVGTYGEIGVTASVGSTPELIAGQDEQEIGKIIITESIGESLVDGRSVTLTLPEGARWQPEYEYDDDDSNNLSDTLSDLDDFDEDEGVKLEFSEFSGTDNRTAKFIVDNEDDDGDAATLELENVEIAIEPGFQGDINLEVGGTTGIEEQSVKIATVKSAITATAASTPDVVIGLSNQKAGEFTIKENVAGAFSDEDGSDKVILDLPAGLYWIGTPTVEVTEGDLDIANVQRANGDNQVTFTVDSESSTPSTIKVTNAVIKLDRTVAEGGVSMKVQGTAVAATCIYSDWTNSDTAAKCDIAKVVTPAGEVGNTAVFSFGSTTYTVNGVEKTASVAPYAENNRTYTSIRDVAYALGITDDNIVWNQENQTVTLIKDAKFVQLKLGSSDMLVGGVTVSMDVAVSAKDNYTTLPAAWVAKAFGCTATFDATANTVTIK